jgi:hypothetical protein
MLRHMITLACVLLAARPAMAQERPPAGYESWGVCPFECCTYGEWTADADIPVHAGRSERSPVLFRLRRDEVLEAPTGVVVTATPSLVRVDRPVRDGYIKGSEQPQLALKRGDVVYLLSPLGEGFYLYWYHGKVYESGLDMAAMPGVGGQEAQMVWWKLVRNKAGQIGWTRSNDFRNVDACG